MMERRLEFLVSSGCREDEWGLSQSMKGLLYLRIDVTVECDLVVGMTGVGFAMEYKVI